MGFVNREEEIKKVFDIVEATINGTVAVRQKRHFVFKGGVGIGKTELIRHLYQKLQLDARSDIYDIYMVFCGKIDGGDSLRAVKIDTFLQVIPSLTASKKTIVVLLDSVDELSEGQLTHLLEEMANLIINPNVISVTTIRNQRYFQLPRDVRLSLEFVELETFDLDVIQRQLLDIGTDLSRESLLYLQKISKGIPLLNDILVRFNIDYDYEFNQILSYRTVLSDHEQKEEIRYWIEVLCILQVLDSDERIHRLHSTYCETDEPKTDIQVLDNQQPADFQNLVLRLNQLNILNWVSDHGGYVMDKTLKTVAEFYLQQHKPSLWRSLHSTAEEFYNEYAQKYPPTAVMWKNQAKYHHEKLVEGPIDFGNLFNGGGAE